MAREDDEERRTEAEIRSRLETSESRLKTLLEHERKLLSALRDLASRPPSRVCSRSLKEAFRVAEREIYGLESELGVIDEVEPSVSPSNLLVSSVRVETIGGHDRVSIWNRGTLAGQLVVALGDGEVLAEALRTRFVRGKRP